MSCRRAKKDSLVLCSWLVVFFEELTWLSAVKDGSFAGVSGPPGMPASSVRFVVTIRRDANRLDLNGWLVTGSRL